MQKTIATSKMESRRFFMAELNLSVRAVSEDRTAHILLLRDLALNLVHESGRWERFGETPVMTVKDHGGLSIIFMTPFQRRKGSKDLLGYALSISVGEGQVLSLLSTEMTSPIFVETYDPGVWEDVLRQPHLTANLAA
jgi:hypothetical protein